MRRGRLEILFEILEAVKTESNITNIMFQARVSYKFLTEKLDSLVEAGFVEIRGNPDWQGGARKKRRYVLTEKGRKLLYHGREIMRLLKGKSEML